MGLLMATRLRIVVHRVCRHRYHEISGMFAMSVRPEMCLPAYCLVKDSKLSDGVHPRPLACRRGFDFVLHN